jgi:hypothetical protein
MQKGEQKGERDDEAGQVRGDERTRGRGTLHGAKVRHVRESLPRLVQPNTPSANQKRGVPAGRSSRQARVIA